MSKSTTPKLTESEIINLFCDAVNQAGGSQPSNPKLTLFVGKQMLVSVSTPAHRSQEVSPSWHRHCRQCALKGKTPTATALPRCARPSAA
jgi:hypothetical protein